MHQHVHLVPLVFLPLYIYKPVLLFLLTLSRLNSKWPLTSLSQALHAQMAPLQSSWVTWLCSPLWHSFSVHPFSLKSSSLIYADLLTCFIWRLAYQGRPWLSPEELFLENWPALLQPYSLPGSIPCHSLKVGKPSLLTPRSGLGSCYFLHLWIFWTPICVCHSQDPHNPD